MTKHQLKQLCLTIWHSPHGVTILWKGQTCAICSMHHKLFILVSTFHVKQFALTSVSDCANQTAKLVTKVLMTLKLVIS